MKNRAYAAAILAFSTALISGSVRAEPVVVQYQSSNLGESQFEPVWRASIAEFEAANPDIKVEPVIVPRKDAWTKFVTAAQARQAPCIAAVDATTAAANGYLMPLDKFWDAEPESWKQVWDEGLMKGMRWEGKLYAIPYWGGIFADIYNRDLVEKAGLDPNSPPKTWAEYLDWAKKMTGPGQWGVTVLGGPTDSTTRVLLGWIYSNGGEPFNETMTESRFAADPKTLEAIKFYLGLATKEKVTPPSPTTTNYLEQSNLFAQNKLGSMRTAYWAVAKVLGDNPTLKGKMFVAPPPGQVSNVPVVAYANTLSISADCKHPEAAWKYIKFDSERKWAIERAMKANYMPLRKDLVSSPEVQADPILQGFLKMGSNSKPYPLPHPAWSEIATKDIVDAVQRALLEPDRVEAIFKDLDTRLNKKLKEL